MPPCLRYSAFRFLIAFWVVLLPATSFFAAPKPASQPLTTVPHVELQRYAGRWYEIARYPTRFEKDCDHDVTADYALQTNGKLSVINTCLTVAGKSKQSKGSAKIADASTNAKLKVTFFWPFYGDYWIIDLDPHYDYAVVGEPSRNYLWILSRKAKLSDATYNEIISRLPDKGYDASRLMKTTQTATK